MVLAGAVSVLLFAGLATALVRTEWPAEAKTGGGGRIADFGKELLTTYLVPFEVASVMLLVVMIAAAYLARQEDEGA
jgi:NADH:ubiquinone oxidoreductase subunit 6 (subunit J)